MVASAVAFVVSSPRTEGGKHAVEPLQHSFMVATDMIKSLSLTTPQPHRDVKKRQRKNGEGQYKSGRGDRHGMPPGF